MGYMWFHGSWGNILQYIPQNNDKVHPGADGMLRAFRDHDAVVVVVIVAVAITTNHIIHISPAGFFFFSFPPPRLSSCAAGLRVCYITWIGGGEV